MARTLLDLAKSLERRAVAIGEAGNESAKRKATAVISYLVRVTPVDTSKAISNWQLTLNTPTNAARAAFFPGVAGSTQVASADNTLNFALAVLQDKKPGDTIYISNVLPYIRRLNDGWSTQNPGAFVEAAALLARKTK